MSDTYIFSNDPRTGALPYDQLQARRRIALALASRARPFPKNIGEGLTYLGEALGENYADSRLASAEAAQKGRDNVARTLLLGGDPAAPAAASPAAAAPAPQAAPAPVSQTTDPEGAVTLASYTGAAPTAPATPDVEQLAPGGALDSGQPITPAQASRQPSMSIEEWKQRIARNESGGRKDAYTLVGERSRRGDYPYGKYQVMGENIPNWTQAYLGRKMTPKEFLADPDAQEQIATARGNEYITKYGPNGAAAAWFAGEKGMNDPKRKDTLGTHVAEYGRRFNIPLASREQLVASAARPTAFAPDEGAMPPEATPASAPVRGDIAAALMQQQGLSQPPPQPVAQAAPVQTAQVAPQMIQRAPEERPTPAGPEPTLRGVIGSNPQQQRLMENARRIASDNTLSDDLRVSAQRRYEELTKQAQDEYTKQWTVWHERTKGEEAFRLGGEERQRKRQGDITPAPVTQQFAGPDPRLGTPASPQRTGIPVPPPPPPGTSPEAWSKEQTPQLAKAIEAVDKATPSFNDAIKTIQLARQHPGREWGVGATAKIATSIPGTDAFGFGKIMEQVGGKNFLTAYSQLKGGGAITEIEGTKAEAAQARLATAQNDRDWSAAMKDLENALRRDMELAQRKINAPVTAWRVPGDNSSVAPDIGERRGDKEYIGGNPADAMSWKRAQ